jgi:hypothetical protein
LVISAVPAVLLIQSGLPSVPAGTRIQFGGFLLSTNTGTGARDVNLKEGQNIWLQLGQDLTLSDAGDLGPPDR